MKTNAAIYIADPSMLGSRLIDGFDEVISYQSVSDGDKATGLVLTLAWGTMTLNFMPTQQFDEHMAGFEGYVRTHLFDSDSLTYALARLLHVRMCLGCIIEHEEDSEDFVTFLFQFYGALNGILFFYDRAYDFNGDILASSRDDEESN